jgi:hypothetical protein
MEFGGLDNPNDHQKWQGRPHDLKALDEVTEMREHQARFVMGWNRSADPEAAAPHPSHLQPADDCGRAVGHRILRPMAGRSPPEPCQPGELRGSRRSRAKISRSKALIRSSVPRRAGL